MATNNAAEMIPRIALKGTLGVSGPLNSDYDALINKPQINGNELAGNKTNAELGIPTELADLTADADHRTVSDTEKETWNAKSDFSGSYNDLTDVPEDLVEDAEYVHTDNNYTNAEKTKLGDIESGAEVNVQADWNETDTSSDAYIQNKPTIPAAQVNSDWNASSGVAEILHKPTLGTAAAKDYTGSVLENSTDLVESGAVKTAIDNAISSVYKPAGNKACAELVSALLIAANLGNVYNMTDDGVTTADFVEGAGKAIEAGDNVVIVDIGSSVYKFDLLSGMVDLSNYVQKSSTAGLIKNDGTIDQTAYAKQNEMSVSTNGDQTTIQLKNGTTATVINAHQDISGKANKSEMTVTPGTGSDADKTTIQLKSGTDATVLTQHQDISGKVDKEQGKGLSTNDYTTAEKEKLTAISTEANKVTASETNGNIQIDGTETTVYDDTELQGAVSDLEDDVEEIQGEITTETTTIEGNPLNFSTKSAQNAKSTILSVEPIQDLHGFDKPWVGGAGKNLLPMTIDAIKSLNTSGSWNGNTYILNNTTFEILVDSDNNVIGIKVNTSGASANTTFTLQTSSNLGNASYIINGCPIGGGNDTYRITVYYGSTYAFDTGSGAGIVVPSGSTIGNVNIRIGSGTVVSNKTFYPMLRLSTETDATFQPYTNIASISGRTEIGILGCGKNLLNPNISMANGYYNDDGDLQSSTRTGHSELLKTNPNTNYTLKLKVNWQSTRRFGFYFWDENKNWISRDTVDLVDSIKLSTITPSNCKYISLQLMIGDGVTDVGFDISQSQLELGNQATAFEPYQESNDLTISLGQTVYGGTLDVENGVLVVDKVMQDLGLLNYNKVSDQLVFYTAISSIKYVTSSTEHINAISSHYQIANSVAGNSGATSRPDKSIFGRVDSDRVYIKDSAYDNAQDFKNAMDGVQLVYELAEPISINLTPHTINLLKGANNISTDGDKITLTYRDGKVATLGDLTSAVDNLDNRIDESKILTDTATGDKYILVVTNGVLSVEQISN